jgi:Asp/Glu/hydantoin racemase
MATTRGGKTVYGASVGILMLETRFPRIPGDIGNALSWPFPVQYRVVRGATPDNIVRGATMDRLDDFINAGRDLVAMGCDGITTNCGFLGVMQAEMAAALQVPVMTSSLMQVPMVEATLPPGKRVGVLTISAESLSPELRAATGLAPDTPVVGTEGGRAFSRDILGDAAEIDFDACRLDLLDAADQLVTAHRQVVAIVLECTNMVPFAADIRRATGLPVFSIHTGVSWFQAGLMPRRFARDLDDPRGR